MKKCPQCSRTYPDDTLAFCLEDGALLSASYDPQATNAPTVAISAGEVQTVVANEIPTVVASKEIPTVVNSSRVTEQTEAPRIRRYIYLSGFIVTFLVRQIETYLLFPPYARMTEGFFTALEAKLALLTKESYLIAMILMELPLYLFVFSLMGLIFGYIWSEGKWKWGFILTLPNVLYRIYYFSDIVINEKYGVLPYFISSVIVLFIITGIACFFAYLGSRLKEWTAERAS